MADKTQLEVIPSRNPLEEAKNINRQTNMMKIFSGNHNL